MRCQKSPLWCRLAYGAKFSKINPSGHIYVIKGMFSDQVMFMVRIPFNSYHYNPVSSSFPQVLKLIENSVSQSWLESYFWKLLTC